MTARSTRHSTVRLWTGAVALLLVCGSAGSQGASALDEAITEGPAGSVEPLRKVDAAGESATLKPVRDVPEAAIDGTTVDKLPTDPATESNGAGVDRVRPVGKSERLQLEESLKDSGVAAEPGAKTSSAPEFSENEDIGTIDDSDGNEDREPTTPPPKREVVGKDDTPKVAGANGDEAGVERPEEKGPEIGVSLANDTNVNYGVKKPVKKGEGDLGGPKSHQENATNVIATGSDVTDSQSKGKGPKAQVEVVKDTTLPKVLRITEAAAGAADERREAESLGSTARESVVETDPNAVTAESKDLASGADVDGEKRGRTISFGGTNEFVTSENKTGGLARASVDVTDSPVSVDKVATDVTDSPVSADKVATGITAAPVSADKVATDVTDAPKSEFKAADFKPYPYARTSNRSSSSDGGRAESTEETSALENTIGQSQQDKKFVVTEPSLVIDNSIQQFKPTYYKRSGNVTRIATSPSTLVASLEDGKLNATTPSAGSFLGNDTTVFVPSPPIFNTENDVPRGRDEAVETSATARDTGSGLDLTGNGITEVIAGVKNDSIRASEDSGTTASTILRAIGGSGATDDSPLVENSTEKIATIGEPAAATAPTSVDVQTDPEESMLRISSLNVTEGSTRVASDRHDSDATPSSIPSSTLSSEATPTATTTTMTTSRPETSAPTNSSTESPTSTSTPTNTPAISTTSTTPEIPTSSPQTSVSLTTATSNSTVSTTTESSAINSSVTPTPTATPQSIDASVLDIKLENQTTVEPEESTDGLPAGSRGTEEFSPESTTSKIEYVFVGLTESAASQQYIATSENPNAVTPDTELATSSNVAGFSTVASASTVVASTSPRAPINGSESTEETQTPDDNETSTLPMMTLIADNETSEDFTTTEPSVELTTLEISPFANHEDTTESIATTSDNDGDDPGASTTLTNDAVEIATEEIVGPRNFTEAPETVARNTTDTGRAVDASTSPPVAVDGNAGNSSAATEATTSPAITEDTARIPSANSSTERPTTEATPRPSSDPTPGDYGGNSGSKIARPTTTSTPRPVTSATPNDTSGVVTDGSIEILHRGGVPSLVKVVFEGSWADVCPHLEVLRQSLADLLTSGLEKTVLARQIVFQNNPCTGGYSASTMTTEASITTLLLYVVDESGNFDGEMTKTLPSLYSKSPIKLQIRSFQLVQDSDSGNAIAVVVVSCVALICLVLLAGLLFIMRKRQTRFNYGERCRPVSLDAYSLDSVSAYNSVRRKGAARASKRSYGNPTFEDSSAIPSHPLNFAGLSSFCNEQNAISEEFAGIPQVTARIDELPQGAEVKNRYANVVPLPETRVSLMKINNDPLTEYINASYVRGPKNATKYYIACQAPIESTVTDFWRMIWEQQSKVVIMLTDLVENGVEKCAEYIPPSEVTDCHRLFGDFQITLKKRETKEKYAISTLHLKNLENNTFREISHIWYLWPANGVQSDAAGLIAVLLEARALQRGGPGPIVVHCSPGTGRTGTLIALDLGIRQYEITRTVDVPRVVYTIRRDRAGAVQTKEQYAFIYKALNLYATKLAGGALDS